MVSKTRRFVFTHPHAAAVALFLGLLTGVTGLAGAVPAGGQDSAGGQTLEGTWRVEITLRNCVTGLPFQNPFPALATFARGGTVTTADGGLSPTVRGTGLGTWGRVPEGAFTATTEAFLFAGGVRSGTQRITQRIDVASHGGEFSADVTTEIQDTAGNVIGTGCATSVGRRFE
jgi:hypothetical protein